MLFDFMITILIVFALGGLISLLAVGLESGEQSISDFYPQENKVVVEDEPFSELADAIRQDEELLAAVSPVNVPHIELPGAIAGGGATAEACSKTVGVVALKPGTDPEERRQYNRRLRDRRIRKLAGDEEHRMLQRRVWLRRVEDQRGQKLVKVSEAAEMLGVPVEQMYKWIDQTDIPFCHVSEAKRKAIRFDVNALLAWHSAYKRSGGAG